MLRFSKQLFISIGMVIQFFTKFAHHLVFEITVLIVEKLYLGGEIFVVILKVCYHLGTLLEL